MKSLITLVALATLSVSAAFAAPPAGHPTASAAHMDMASMPEVELTQKGTVLSTIDANEYTYIEVAQGQQTTWLASRKMALKKGNVIRFDNGIAMTNFHSKVLNRTFPSVTFVNRVAVASEK